VRPVTVYGELLQMALDADAEIADRSVNELIALVITRRQMLKREGFLVRSETPLVNSLAYDAALVQLCRRMGIEQTLSQSAGPEERRMTEKRLVELLPELASALQ
jgi:hypothetical protein